MTQARPAIPEPIKRAVRQRCGFGCVICGLPIYDYEHMEEWAKVKRHVASEITLLCPHHHREITNSLLPIDDVRKADSDPCNLRTGVSTGYDLHYSGGNCNFIVGGCSFYFNNKQSSATAIVFAIRNVPLLAFTFEDGQVLLSIQIFNSAGDRVLWIDRNELRYRVETWDVKFEGQVLEVRKGKGHVLFEVRFAPPDRIEITRGYLQLFGYEILVRPEAMYFLNQASVATGSRYSFSHVGIMVDLIRPIPTAMVTGGNANFRERSREEVVKFFAAIGYHFVLDESDRFIFKGVIPDSPLQRYLPTA